MLEGVIWIFTARCQLNCVHCYTKRFLEAGELSLEEKLKLVREAAELGVSWVNLTGGEPLIHPHFWVVAREIKDYGMEVYINTNGVAIDDEVASMLSRVADGVYVSLDGGRRGHEAMRGPGTYERALNAIKTLKRFGVRTSTVMTVSKLNWREVRDYIRTAAKLGVETPALIPTMPQGRAVEAGIWVDSDTYASAVRMAADEAVRVRLGSVWLWCTPFAELLDERGVLYNTFCRTRNIVDVDPAGRLLLCDMLDLPLASVRKEGGLAKALEVYASRREVMEVVEPPSLPEPCVTCRLRRACRGGCFARSKLIYGELNAGDPLCPRVEAWRQRLRGEQD